MFKYKTYISAMQSISNHWVREELKESKLLEKSYKKKWRSKKIRRRRNIDDKKMQKASMLEMGQKLKEVRRLKINQNLNEGPLLKKRRTETIQVPDEFKTLTSNKNQKLDVKLKRWIERKKVDE
ncbi:hypothetical protein [Holospora curviuscula]|uniref:Uncharacterized protein n=1 Tax=Holospora curviuscula TaxID=1082868 RepID=A0A2S5R7C2_9PROT|nr:hypothetical protein [Holospora curviuscula]PPE03187.1 hypothetical protein HCUR_01365 [Holospora curviuscula]